MLERSWHQVVSCVLTHSCFSSRFYHSFHSYGFLHSFLQHCFFHSYSENMDHNTQKKQIIYQFWLFWFLRIKSHSETNVISYLWLLLLQPLLQQLLQLLLLLLPDLPEQVGDSVGDKVGDSVGDKVGDSVLLPLLLVLLCEPCHPLLQRLMFLETWGLRLLPLMSEYPISDESFLPPCLSASTFSNLSIKVRNEKRMQKKFIVSQATWLKISDW